MSGDFSVVAVIATYNEADIIDACLRHLHAQGVSTYLIDDGSSDDTVRIAEQHLGRGLIGIERLPPLSPPRFSLSRILARKEDLCATLPASWFINHDADEFRESLWSELDLRGALQRVDALGWNAVDFEVFEIPPVGDPQTAIADPDAPPPGYRPGRACDRVQIRAWRRQPVPVDLRSTGGHEARFDGRRVFPLPFPMRHYPVRSREHGRRKLERDRRPRYDPAERERGWHVQYDIEERPDVAAPGDVLPFDLATARALCALRNRDLEAAQSRIGALSASVDALNEQLQERIATLEAQRTELASLRETAAGLRHELDAVYASRSWRWMAPLRAAYRLLGGR